MTLTQEERHALAMDHWPVCYAWLREHRWVMDALGRDDALGICGLALAHTSARHDPGREPYVAYLRKTLKHMLLTAAIAALPPVGVSVVSLTGRDGEDWHDPPAPDDGYDRDAVRGRLDEVLAGIPGHLAQALRLSYLDGLSDKEVGRRLGVTASRAWRWRALALQILRRRVGNTRWPTLRHIPTL